MLLIVVEWFPNRDSKCSVNNVRLAVSKEADQSKAGLYFHVLYSSFDGRVKKMYGERAIKCVH